MSTWVGRAALLVSTAGAVVLRARFDAPLTGSWASPALQFWFVTAAGAGCLVAALAVVVVGWRDASAEVAVLGTALSVLSGLSVLHGLTTPYYLYGPNRITALAAELAVPLAMLTAAPILVPVRRAGRAAIARWRAWSSSVLVSAAGVVGLALAAPRMALLPSPGGVKAGIVLGLALVAVGRLASRHHRLYRIGRRRASLGAAGALVYLGLAAVIGFLATPSSGAWWAAHTLDAAAVLAVCAGVLVAYRSDRRLGVILAPVVNRDPLVALELGLAPEVHAFVAALELKDEVTRDHVVRVAELAMTVGQRAGLSPDRLRNLGLAGLLHDIGKLVVPSEILGKRSGLNDEEFALIRTHSERGAALLVDSPILGVVAALVRAHHERPDGAGYPDGLGWSETTLDMGIVSVCDAWDAMTNDRQYRSAMSAQAAAEIIADGAGSQWRSDAVELLLVEAGVPRRMVFDRVGRTGDAGRVLTRGPPRRRRSGP